MLARTGAPLCIYQWRCTGENQQYKCRQTHRRWNRHNGVSSRLTSQTWSSHLQVLGVAGFKVPASISAEISTTKKQKKSSPLGCFLCVCANEGNAVMELHAVLPQCESSSRWTDHFTMGSACPYAGFMSHASLWPTHYKPQSSPSAAIHAELASKSGDASTVPGWVLNKGTFIPAAPKLVCVAYPAVQYRINPHDILMTTCYVSPLFWRNMISYCALSKSAYASNNYV